MLKTTIYRSCAPPYLSLLMEITCTCTTQCRRGNCNCKKRICHVQLHADATHPETFTEIRMNEHCSLLMTEYSNHSCIHLILCHRCHVLPGISLSICLCVSNFT